MSENSSMSRIHSNGSDTAIANAGGKTIRYAEIDAEANGKNGALCLGFVDGTYLVIMDDGQSCCEHRYLYTYDDLSQYVGSTFISAKVQPGPNVEDDSGDVHEMAFLHVQTSTGTFVIETHNEHNGYYGGFWVVAQSIPA